MKFIIAVVLLAAVVDVYSEPQQASISAKAGADTGAGGGKPKNLSPQDIAAIEAILRKIVGPKLSGAVTKLVASLANGA